MNIYDIKRDSDAKDQWFTMTSKIRVPVKVAGNSYYLPATSNAGLFKGYVIDPGSVGYDDFGQDNVHSVLITHGHNDHFRHAHEFRGRGASMGSSRKTASCIRPILYTRRKYGANISSPTASTRSYAGNRCIRSKPSTSTTSCRAMAIP